MKKILFITNGHAEDLVADQIIKQLSASEYKTDKLPLVDTKLPSGGFSFRNFKYLIQDIAAGLFGNTIKHLKLLKKYKGKYDLVIAIGDIVPIIAALNIKCPFIFVGVNKSSYYKSFGSSYTPWEKLLLKRYAKKVYLRDKITAKDLKFGEYVGNPLLDLSGEMTNDKLKMSNEGRTIIGFLPGTRKDAKVNLEDFDKIAEEIVKMKEPEIELKFITATTEKDVPAFIENMTFDNLLAQADLVIGLSGTGNEQVAGEGIPVISFYGRGAQYNKGFAKAQKQLLGKSLSLIKDNDPILVAAEVWDLIRHPHKRESMAKAGQERMGEKGACKKIAQFINETLK